MLRTTTLLAALCALRLLFLVQFAKSAEILEMYATSSPCQNEHDNSTNITLVCTVALGCSESNPKLKFLDRILYAKMDNEKFKVYGPVHDYCHSNINASEGHEDPCENRTDCSRGHNMTISVDLALFSATRFKQPCLYEYVCFWQDGPEKTGHFKLSDCDKHWSKKCCESDSTTSPHPSPTPSGSTTSPSSESCSSNFCKSSESSCFTKSTIPAATSNNISITVTSTSFVPSPSESEPLPSITVTSTSFVPSPSESESSPSITVTSTSSVPSSSELEPTNDVPAAITALASSMSVLFIIAVFSIVVNIVLTLLLFKTKSRQSQLEQSAGETNN